jgi:hypothetical protein
VLRALGVRAGAVRLFVNGAILVAVILFAPNGLAGLARRRRGPQPLSSAGAPAAVPHSAGSADRAT